MPPSQNSDRPGSVSVTGLLNNVHTDPDAAELAYRTLKQQLKIMAERQMTSADGLSIEASHVVNQVFLKLTGNSENSWQDRAQFFAYACREIRSFLVDRARARLAAKRNSGQKNVDIDQAGEVTASTLTPAEHAELNDELLKLDTVLPLLKQSHPKLHTVVNLHFFGDLSFDQIGRELQIDGGTARRWWERARIILQREMMRICSESE
jgi:RNA polymerase sigma factor (TIGR02999 family)